MHELTLYDGSKIECYPIALPHENEIKDEHALDTTAGYIKIAVKKKQLHPEKVTNETLKNEQLFYEHAHLFLANANKILSDSRLFLTTIDIPNNLAYTDRSGLRHATLGVYIEWWLYHKEASIDAKGRPIWFISGSPLSGRNACSSVDRKGKTHRAKLNGRFSDVWKSFMEVNNRYSEAKGRYLAYDLQEVVAYLEGHTDNQQLFMLHLRLEKARYDNYISNLKKALVQSREAILEYTSKIQHLLVRQHKDAVEEYYKKCVNLQCVAKLSREFFREKRRELRKQLRNGLIDNRFYQKQITQLRKQAEENELECYRFEKYGLVDLIGDDANLLTFAAVESILTELKPDLSNSD